MGGYGSGGARKNAGRRSFDGEPRSKLSVSLPAWLLTMLHNEAEHRKISVSQLITDVLTKEIVK